MSETVSQRIFTCDAKAGYFIVTKLKTDERREDGFIYTVHYKMHKEGIGIKLGVSTTSMIDKRALHSYQDLEPNDRQLIERFMDEITGVSPWLPDRSCFKEVYLPKSERFEMN